MQHVQYLILILSLLALGSFASAAEVPGPLASRGKPLFVDDFSRAELGAWRSSIPTFTVADGVLKLSIEIVGEAMRVSLDDKPVGHLKSPGIGHATKAEFGFTVSGREAQFDDVRVFAAQ